MNHPISADHHDRYDTVIDAGTTEHVFNVLQALKNYSDICKVGGQIMRMMPSNNYCGHGFSQLSPKLLFSLYSERNAGHASIADSAQPG